MAKEPASVQLTGGAGFGFEDQVAAFFAAALLTGTQPFGPDIGGVLRLDWQTRDDAGWLLDDLLVTLVRPAEARLAVSIKSGREVTSTGFRHPFPTLAWEQWRGSPPLQAVKRGVDLLGLVVGELADGVEADWNVLLRQALITDPNRLRTRFTTQGISSDTGRKLFTSLQCPSSVHHGAEPTINETVEFIRSVRLIHLDLGSPTSKHRGDAVFTLQQALRSGSAVEADALWKRLLSLCSGHREGGTLTRDVLIHELRPDFALADKPDDAAQWAILHRRSLDHANRVKVFIGSGLQAPRPQALADLRENLLEHSAILVTGASGTGKSAIVRMLVEDPAFCSRCIWLNPEIVADHTLAELEKNLGIDTPLSRLCAESTPVLSALVLDGIDRFSIQGTRTVAALLTSLSEPLRSSGWVVIGTARADSAADTLARLHQAGFRERLIQYPLPYVNRGIVASFLDRTPSLAHLASRRNFLDIFRNLKLLDWVASAASASPTQTDEWLGHAGVLEWVWKGWIGSKGGHLSRANLLKRLGTDDGALLGSGVGTLSVSDAATNTLEELVTLDVLRVRNERVYFTHDLVGDVARLRVLVERSDSMPRDLIAHAAVPRWHAAIRLFGQRLAERSTVTNREWKRCFDGLDDDTTDGALCRNLLIEGVLLSINVDTLLENLWPDLCADDGLLLRRCLEAFAYVATYPDPRIVHTEADPSRRAEFEAYVRIPDQGYWTPVLQVLAQHVADLCRFAPVECGRAVGLWLRKMAPGTPGRSDAAAIAVAIAQEVQAARAEHFRAEKEEEDVIFEAALSAAPERPDDVAQLALELAHRRSEPQRVIDRRQRYQEEQRKRLEERGEQSRRRLTSVDPRLGRRLPQLPDGPKSRVDSGFRETVLSGLSICALATVRPAAATEVLLACALRPPLGDPYGGTDIMQRVGVESAERGRPGFYTTGPWLALLHQDAMLGADCIVRLINQATATWELDDRHCPYREPVDDYETPHVTVRFDGEERRWVGDLRVFGWYRNRLIGADTVVSALMALEKWLYDAVDADQDIQPVVHHIWRHSSSVAFLGVLTALGLRNLSLLEGGLSPLLGVWQLDEWTHQLTMEGHLWRIQLNRWWRYGQAAMEEVIKWNTLPHRSFATRQRFAEGLLTRAKIRALLGDVRQWWSTLGALTAEESLTLRRLAALYDIDNYKQTDRGDGTIAVQFEWPDDLKDITSQAAETAARSITDKWIPLSDDNAATVWSELQELTVGDPTIVSDEALGPARTRSDIVVGSIAVLLMLAGKWLEADAKRVQWCEAELAAILDTPPAPTGYDLPQSLSDDTWHGFLAQLGVYEFSSSLEDTGLRWLAARSILQHRYRTTGLAMRIVYRMRDTLGTEFHRLVNLCILWSALNATRYFFDSEQTEEIRFAVRAERLASAFVRKTVPVARMDILRIGRIAQRAYERADRKRFPAKYAKPLAEELPGGASANPRRRKRVHCQRLGLQPELLASAFEWLPEAMKDASSPQDVYHELAEDLLIASLASIPPQDTDENEDEVEGDMGSLFRFTCDLINTIIGRCDDSATAERFWRPILALGPRAHRWIKDFTLHWASSGIQASSSRDAFFLRWREMIAYAESSEQWAGRSFHLAEMWQNLLGLSLAAEVVGEVENEKRVAEMIPTYRQWATRWLPKAWNLRPFYQLLIQPSARSLRVAAIPWIRDAINQIRDNGDEREEMNTLTVRVLRLAWNESRILLSQDPEVREAFLELIALMAKAQGAEALHLRDAVAKSIGTV